MLVRNGGKGEGEDLRALHSMAIHIIRCNDRFPGASAATGSISEEVNGRREEVVVVAKEAIPEQSAQ